MSEKLPEPGPQNPHELADIAKVDIYGRGHRPDGSGKFMSNYELGQVEAHQGQIRNQTPKFASELVKPTDTAPDALSDIAPDSLKTPTVETSVTDAGLAELSAEMTGIEAGEAVPDTTVLGTEEFVQARGGRLRGAWQKAKSVLSKTGDTLAIEHSGYRFSPAENARARMGNFRWLWRAVKDQSRSADGRNAVLSDPLQNRGIASVVARRQEAPLRRARSSEENFADRSRLDTVKIAAYELATLPVIRMGGMMALYGAAKATRKITGSERAGRVTDSLGYRLELHEQGLHNPTLRKLNGVKWKEVKPSNVVNIDQLPIVNRLEDDLSGMDGSTAVRVDTRNPFAEDETPVYVATTVDQLRTRGVFEPIPTLPAAEIKAAADARTQSVQTVEAPLRRNPFAD